MKEITKELQLRKIEKNKEIYYSKTLRLGKGAFGEVFLGFDESSHNPFACKIISLEKISTQNNQEVLIKKIKDEIVNMQIARNQHIVEFYQAKTSERNIYILCEYCNGDNLERYLKNRGYLTENEALTFFREILQGFYNLRQRNIVHRDIKPANLLMHNYSLKIADLGFSKSIENHEQLLQSVVGSPLYMSPQIFEQRKYTQKTDIWSLGVIFYEMLYGRNPFAGCSNLMELKQRVKKDIQFPKYPYVSTDTKNMIRKIMVVEEKDRIDWEFLFEKYLLNAPMQSFPQMKANYYTINNSFYRHFRESYYIQSHQHLHKVLKEIKLCTEQELSKAYPFYQTSEQFFSQIYFCMVNKPLIEEYFAYFIERRNKISYLIVLSNKLCALMATIKGNEELSVFIQCIYLLIYKYSLTLLEEMITNEGKTIIFDGKYESVHNKFCYEKFLAFLLNKDRELIRKQLSQFIPCFRSMLSGLSQSNAPLFATIQGDLSGIYLNDQGDRRVTSFYLNNYFKKVHQILKTIILTQNSVKSNEMISEEQQNQNQFIRLPHPTVVICRLIQEYLINPQLFSLNIQSSNRNTNSITASQFRRNLNQILYDYQTTVEQSYFMQLSSSKPFEQQSIISFMSKQIKWNSFFIPQLI